jgi:hypothetical protein
MGPQNEKPTPHIHTVILNSILLITFIFWFVEGG